MKFKARIRETGGTYVITIPRQYLIDGHLTPGEFYDVTMEEVEDADE